MRSSHSIPFILPPLVATRPPWSLPPKLLPVQRPSWAHGPGSLPLVSWQTRLRKAVSFHGNFSANDGGWWLFWTFSANYVCICVHTCVNKERERVREWMRYTCVIISMCVIIPKCLHMSMYVICSSTRLCMQPRAISRQIQTSKNTSALLNDMFLASASPLWLVTYPRCHGKIHFGRLAFVHIHSTRWICATIIQNTHPRFIQS